MKDIKDMTSRDLGEAANGVLDALIPKLSECLQLSHTAASKDGTRYHMVPLDDLAETVTFLRALRSSAKQVPPPIRDDPKPLPTAGI